MGQGRSVVRRAHSLGVATLLAIGALASPRTARAQPDEDRPRIQAGVFYGMNWSTLSDVSGGILKVGAPSHKTRRRAQNGGASVTFPLNQRYAIQLEGHYEERGTNIVLNNDTSGTQLQLRMDYLEFPVLFRADLGRQGARFHPMLIAGPSFAVRGPCSLEAKTHSGNLTQDCMYGATDDNPTPSDPFKRTDVRLTGAIGVVMNGQGEMYLLQLRYTQGITNLSALPSITAYRPKSQAITLLIGITK